MALFTKIEGDFAFAVGKQYYKNRKTRGKIYIIFEWNLGDEGNKIAIKVCLILDYFFN